MKDLELYSLLDKLIKNRVKTKNGCWLYTLFISPGGYGRTNFRNKKVLVHRFIAYVVWGLDLNDKKQKSLHSCDIPACFNPEHIFVSTQQDNIKDMMLKGRSRHSRKTICKNGHELTLSNLYFYSGRQVCRACKLKSVAKYQESLIKV